MRISKKINHIVQRGKLIERNVTHRKKYIMRWRREREREGKRGRGGVREEKGNR